MLFYLVMIAHILFVRGRCCFRPFKSAAASTSSSSTSGTSRLETSFFIQSLIICAVLQLQIVPFLGWVPSWLSDGSNQWYYVYNFASNNVSSLTNMMHAVVIISFNSKIRREIGEFFSRNHNNHKFVTPVTAMA